MEPVTHMLTGACLSRSGLNRKAAYATLTMVIAAEFPDIDTLWGLRGPIEGFQHHRGITHTFLGLPFEAALIVAGVYGWHWWRVRRRSRFRIRLPLRGMTTKKATATATATATAEATATATATAKATAEANTGVSPLRGTMESSRSGREDESLVGGLGGGKQRSAAVQAEGGIPSGRTTGRATATEIGRSRFPAGMTDRTAATAASATAPSAATDETVLRPLTVAPVRWGVLYGLAMVALLSHLLLDYTNNYGLRPFFPIDDRWYAASIEFIFDPVMFAMLVAGLAAPWLFGLVGSEVGAKKQRFRPRGWAIAALLGVVGWWGLRELEHARAVQMAMAQSIAEPAQSIAEPAQSIAEPAQSIAEPAQSIAAPAQSNVASVATHVAMGGAQVLPPDGLAPAEPAPVYLQTRRTLVSPEPLSPFRWSAAMDFGPVYQLAEIDTRSGTVIMGETTYPKPGRSAAVLTAERSKLGRVYMDWSQMPVVQVAGPDIGPDSVLAEESGAEGGALEGVKTVVTFRDLRFMGGWLGETGRSALVGTVGLDGEGRVVQEVLRGRRELAFVP